MLEAALKLAQAGMAVFPVRVDKTPATPHGFHDATTDRATILDWTWDGLIGAAIGEGQIVVDVDPRNGGDTTLSLFPALPKTRTTQTRSGGRHYWLAIPSGISLRGSLGPGIDVKRPGKGYVIVPPSAGYVYVRGGKLAQAPKWLIAELVVAERSAMLDTASKPKFFPFEQGTAYGLVARANALERLSNAPEGSRNDELNKAAFTLAQLEAGGELAREATLGALLAVAEEIGLTEWEARNTIESGWSAGEQEPRQAPPRET